MSQVATLQSVQEKVKDRIQATFMEILPPEMFEEMVGTALADFTKTELPALVKQAAKERLQEQLKEEFGKPEWQGLWRNAFGGGHAPSTMVEMIVKQAAPELVTAIFGGFVQGVVQQMRNGSIRQY